MVSPGEALRSGAPPSPVWAGFSPRRRLCTSAAPTAPWLGQPAERAALVEGLGRHNIQSGGSATMRIARCLILTEPPSIDANEVTDKGYLNQRAVLARRAALVERLHAASVDDEVIVID